MLSARDRRKDIEEYAEQATSKYSDYKDIDQRAKVRQQEQEWEMSGIVKSVKEGLIKSTCADWRANFHAPRGKKSQEYFVYFKIF